MVKSLAPRQMAFGCRLAERLFSSMEMLTYSSLGMKKGWGTGDPFSFGRSFGPLAGSFWSRTISGLWLG